MGTFEQIQTDMHRLKDFSTENKILNSGQVSAINDFDLYLRTESVVYR